MIRSELPGDLPASRYRYAKRRYRALFGIVDRLGSAAGAALEAMRRPTTPESLDPKRILVVQLDHIGDAVLTTPLLGSLKQRYPTANLDVLASQANHAIFRSSPHVARVHVSARNWHARRPRDQSWLPEVVRLGRQLRRFDYDWGIDPRGDFLVVLMLWLASIPRRVGWPCGGGAFLLTDVAAWDPSRHELESRRVLLERIGVRVPAAQFRPELAPSWSDLYCVRERLQSILELRTPLVALHIGAGTPAKRWPSTHWSALIATLLDRIDGTIVLLGDVQDSRLGRDLARRCANVVDWTGRLALMQMAAFLREANLFIGCDSGPAHIAAAMGTPSVVLFSGTNRSECWSPAGPMVQVLRNPVSCAPCHRKTCPVPGHPCLSGISPYRVAEIARATLEESVRALDTKTSDWPADPLGLAAGEADIP
jgi:lipopolysaccharide heptosyltransferase II